MSKSIDEQISHDDGLQEWVSRITEAVRNRGDDGADKEDVRSILKKYKAQAEKEGYHNGRYDLSNELIPELEKNLTQLRKEQDNE